jgi:hypothetical protein
MAPRVRPGLSFVPGWFTPLGTRRVQDLPEARSDYVVTAVPTGLLSAANSLLFWASGLQSDGVLRRSWKWSDA